MAIVTREAKAVIVRLPADEIVDWDSFHAIFRRVFGFPDFYGYNMDAWIDCMTDLDDFGDGMSQVKVEPGSLVVLEVANAEGFKRRCPEQFEALVECAAFVNQRRAEASQRPVLALALL